MMIWKISQNINNDYDTYSDATVIAADIESARLMHPDGSICDGNDSGAWVNPENVIVELIGVSVIGTEPRVITASFHSG